MKKIMLLLFVLLLVPSAFALTNDTYVYNDTLSAHVPAFWGAPTSLTYNGEGLYEAAGVSGYMSSINNSFPANMSCTIELKVGALMTLGKWSIDSNQGGTDSSSGFSGASTWSVHGNFLINTNITQVPNVWTRLGWWYKGDGSAKYMANGTIWNVSSGAHTSIGTIFLGLGSTAPDKNLTARNFLCWRGDFYDEPGYGGPPPPPGVQNNLSISVKDIYSLSSLVNFSALINGTLLLNTTTGQINTSIASNSTALFNITIRSPQNGGYFNKTYTNYNVSSALTAYLSQSDVRLSAYLKISNSSVLGSFFINDTARNSSGNFLSAGTYRFNFTNASYYPQSIIYTIPALFNGTINITGVYDVILNITLRNAYSLQNVTDFFGFAYQNQTGYIEFYNTTTSTASLNLTKADYSVNITKIGYSISADNTKQANLTTSNAYQLNFSLYSNNSVIVNAYDQNTGAVIYGTNLTIIFSGGTETTYTTTTGFLYVENLTDGSYTVKLSGGNYSLTQYPITVASASTQTLNAYLSTSTSTTTFTVQDYDSGAVIENASFIMQRLINATWTTVESKATDITGQAQFTYNIGVKYKFTVTQTGYTTKVFYLDPVLSSSYTVRMTKTTVLTSALDYMGVGIIINPTLFYVSRENNVTFAINSPNGVLVDYYLNVSWPGGNASYTGVNALGGTFGPLGINITGVTNETSRVSFIYGYDSTIDAPKSYKQLFEIIGSYTTGPPMQNNTFISNKDRTYGLGLLDRLIIAIGVAIVVAGVLSMATGAVFGMSLSLIFLAYMVIIGFIPVWSILITMLLGFMLIVKWGGA